MNAHAINNREENKDKLKSGIITAIIWSLILLSISIYKFSVHIPKQKELITQMLINFGDNENGNGSEEPAEQEGSLASTPNLMEEIPAEKTEIIEKSAEVLPTKKETSTEKIITGNNPENIVKKSDNSEGKSSPKKSATSSKSTSLNVKNSNSETGGGKGTEAIGNLIKGRGTKTGTQGDGGISGNSGDPLGGEGNGDSKIGIDRKLVSFIPGTMGRGGTQPAHNCTTSGTINIDYTVDKAGNVISAKRSSGISDNCVVSASIEWVKKYVKAEKANSSSSGTYKITF
jgi:hypothetical protein